MAYQITLSNEDYEALETASVQSGMPIETLVHQAITTQYPLRQPTKTIGSYEYPTGEPDTTEEEAELEQLAQLIGNGRPWPSEMIIEDRGPR